ncbi:hypothetical protein XBO1_380002 [Xenorhabdus bovienii str. oregonense]|uniref:ParB/Sulfiredoxin domain-containing protein n=1 Tax=Xenorhabdus bovienii str. oregonense TaxID=1398202 RepID=A0A077P9Q5_XENBV|nr:hypothetical protein XBO1_380002 [Xenorhabdus bovienii str. oregonense]
MARQHLNMGNALLQQGRQTAATLSEQPPVSEMPMVLTLDQLRPNPDNPRTSRNPRYDDIKASIKAHGLDTVPRVTRDPPCFCPAENRDSTGDESTASCQRITRQRQSQNH